MAGIKGVDAKDAKDAKGRKVRKGKLKGRKEKRGIRSSLLPVLEKVRLKGLRKNPAETR
jgi:hypothetical protein